MARPLSTSGSGSVNHPSNLVVGIELSVFENSQWLQVSKALDSLCLADSRAHAWVGYQDCGLGALDLDL